MNLLLIPFDKRTGRPYAALEADVGDRHWMLAASGAARERGLRVMEIHPVDQDGELLLAWADVVAQRPQPAPKPEAEFLVSTAESRRADLDDDTWTRDITEFLEAAYLFSDSPYGQSGKGGGEAEWEAGRRVIAEAIDGPGSFLDACCANGLLMESMAAWAGVEPYGLDISPRLVDLARRRLPHWADRIWTGDARTWRPPRRFDYVYALPEVTRPHLRRQMMEHLLDQAVAPGGRLIAGQYLSPSNDDLDTEPIWDHLAAWGFEVAGSAVTARTGDPNGPRTEIAWVTR